MIWSMLLLYTWLLFQNFQEPGLCSRHSKWSKFKCLLGLVAILLISSLRRVEKHQRKPMTWLANGACVSVLSSCSTSAFRAKSCCHLIKWYCTYLIRILTSNIKYRPLFKTTSVSNYCHSVCSNFWSICGNVEWDIMFPQAKPKGLLRGKLFEILFLGNERKGQWNLDIVHNIKGRGENTLLAQPMSSFWVESLYWLPCITVGTQYKYRLVFGS